MFVPILSFIKRSGTGPPDPPGDGDTEESLAYDNEIIVFNGLSIGNTLARGSFSFDDDAIMFNNLAIVFDNP